LQVIVTGLWDPQLTGVKWSGHAYSWHFKDYFQPEGHESIGQERSKLWVGRTDWYMNISYLNEVKDFSVSQWVVSLQQLKRGWRSWRPLNKHSDVLIVNSNMITRMKSMWCASVFKIVWLNAISFSLRITQWIQPTFWVLIFLSIPDYLFSFLVPLYFWPTWRIKSIEKESCCLASSSFPIFGTPLLNGVTQDIKPSIS
jgi:hypothetical protein